MTAPLRRHDRARLHRRVPVAPPARPDRLGRAMAGFALVFFAWMLLRVLLAWVRG